MRHTLKQLFRAFWPLIPTVGAQVYTLIKIPASWFAAHPWFAVVCGAFDALIIVLGVAHYRVMKDVDFIHQQRRERGR